MARRGRSSKPRDLLRERRAAETGTLVKEAPDELCLLYPSPYAAGMSSLGFQSLYRAVNETPGRAAHRAFLPDDVDHLNKARYPQLLKNYAKSLFLQ